MNDELRRYPAAVGASQIAFGDPTREEMAIATTRDETYVRIGQRTRSIATQIDPSLNLHTTSAAFGESGLWIGSEMHYEFFTDPELDEEAINARGPHGLGYLELDELGNTITSRRYVSHKPPDTLSDDEIEGLPSNWIADVIALPGARRALVACGIERADRALDHLLPEQRGPGVVGGIAIVEDTEVHTLTTDLVDVIDLAVAGDGAIYALDAQSGVALVDLEARNTEPVLATSLDDDERALSLAILADDVVAIGTNRRLRLYTPTGGLTVVEGTGAVWDLEVLGDGLLEAGTDQGLRVVAIEGAELPDALGPTGPLSRDWIELDWGCFGELDCPCDPGIGAECARGASCDFGACRSDDACSGAGCPCDDVARCDPGFECNLVDGVCEAPPPNDDCVLDCSCATASGCPDGMICQGGFAGFSCI